jgi:hypothetical protein
LFLLPATWAGLPVTVLHVYDDGRATMRGKLLSVVPVLDAAGPEMDRGETVTVFNDMVVLAPAALLSAPVVWRLIVGPRGPRHLHEISGEQVVSPSLHSNAPHELVDFAKRGPVGVQVGRASQQATMVGVASSAQSARRSCGPEPSTEGDMLGA